MKALLKLTRARRLTDAQRDLVQGDTELVAILVGWARRRGGSDYPAEDLVHDCLVVAAASFDPTRARWRTWASSQVRWAFARYARTRQLDRKHQRALLAFAETYEPRARRAGLRSAIA